MSQAPKKAITVPPQCPVRPQFHGLVDRPQLAGQVESGWRAICDILLGAGQTELASRVNRFIDQMPPVRTEKEMIGDGMWSHLHCPNAKGSPRTQLPHSKQ
jgi:hypothetical protein